MGIYSLKPPIEPGATGTVHSPSWHPLPSYTVPWHLLVSTPWVKFQTLKVILYNIQVHNYRLSFIWGKIKYTTSLILDCITLKIVCYLD